MRQFAIAFTFVTLVLGLPLSTEAGFGAFQQIKLGGGILWNDKVALDATGGGAHVSVDLELTGPFNLTPFYEFSRRNDITSTLAGGELHYNAGHFYFGPGFGVADAGGKTKFHVNGVAGIRFDLMDRVGFFVQGKYAWAADDLLNGVTVHGGITLPIMGK